MAGPGRPNEEFLLTEAAVPKGPYNTKNEEWDALSKLIALERMRAEAGFKRFTGEDVSAWTGGLSRAYIAAEVTKSGFIQREMACAKRDVAGELAKMAPQIIAVLKAYTSDLEINKDPRQRKEAVELFMKAAEMFGISEMDLAQATVEETVNTDDVLDALLKDILALTGQTVPVQRMIKRLVHAEGGTQEAVIRESGEPDTGGGSPAESGIQQSEVPAGGPGKGPDTVVETVRVQLEVAPES